MSDDQWTRAARNIREAMETYRRRHRPDYQIIARTAWDEEWTALPPGPFFRVLVFRRKDSIEQQPIFPNADQFIVSLMRDPAFIAARKNNA